MCQGTQSRWISLKSRRHSSTAWRGSLIHSLCNLSDTQPLTHTVHVHYCIRIPCRETVDVILWVVQGTNDHSQTSLLSFNELISLSWLVCCLWLLNGISSFSSAVCIPVTHREIKLSWNDHCHCRYGGGTGVLSPNGCLIVNNWRDPWKNRIYWYISFSAHHSIVFCFRCSVYWWKGSVRF